MPKNLVIVESAKAEAIEKILGQDFKVVSVLVIFRPTS